MSGCLICLIGPYFPQNQINVVDESAYGTVADFDRHSAWIFSFTYTVKFDRNHFVLYYRIHFYNFFFRNYLDLDSSFTWK